jgi:hypothetical protein
MPTTTWHSRALRALLLLLPAAALAACEGDSAGPSTAPRVGELTLNASSQTGFAYLRFEGDSAVAVAAPASDAEWDLALRRYTVRLNGGVGGTKGVAGFNLANNASADTATILSFTAANQLAAFDAVGPADIPGSGSFTSEGLGPDYASWFRFDPFANGLVANPQAAWKVARAGGTGYALVRVARIVATQTTLDSVTFEWRLADQNGDLGVAQQLAVGTTGGLNGVDFGTASAVAASGCGWDVSADVTFLVSVSGGCGTGTFPLDVSQSFASVSRADDAPEYGPFLARVSGPIPSSFSVPTAPFLYDLAGDQRLSPTFNIYLIRVGSAVYKIQLTGYYSDTGASGYPTIRYARIQ